MSNSNETIAQLVKEVHDLKKGIEALQIKNLAAIQTLNEVVSQNVEIRGSNMLFKNQVDQLNEEKIALQKIIENLKVPDAVTVPF